VTAAFSLDAGDDIAVARELIRMRVSLPAGTLADTGTDLFEVMGQW
jgi:hypothetical protein